VYGVGVQSGGAENAGVENARVITNGKLVEKPTPAFSILAFLTVSHFLLPHFQLPLVWPGVHVYSGLLNRDLPALLKGNRPKVHRAYGKNVWKNGVPSYSQL